MTMQPPPPVPIGVSFGDHLQEQVSFDRRELSVIVFGAIEAALTPLMEQIEAAHPEVKVFSLPSVDHPEWGRHVELGVKGQTAAAAAAYADLLAGLHAVGAKLGPELVCD